MNKQLQQGKNATSTNWRRSEETPGASDSGSGLDPRQAELIERLLRECAPAPLENDTMVLVFEPEQWNEGVLCRLDDPVILEAKETDTYAYAILRYQLRDRDYELLRQHYVDVLSQGEFRDRLRCHPGPPAEASRPENRRIGDRAGAWHLSFPAELAESGEICRFARQHGLEFRLFQAVTLGGRSYWDVQWDGPKAAERRLLEELRRRGVEAFPPQPNRVEWLPGFRRAVSNALAVALRDAAEEWTGVFLRIVEQNYSAFPNLAAPLHWIQARDLASAEGAVEHFAKRHRDTFGEGEFGKSLAEFSLLGDVLRRVASGAARLDEMSGALNRFLEAPKFELSCGMQLAR